MQRDRDPRGVSKSLAGGTVKTGVGDLPGMDRIDPDASLRELQDRSLSQTAQPPFARRVGGIVMRGQPGGRGDIDDRAAAAVADRRRAMLHAEHWASQVDRERAVPRIDRSIGNTLAGDRPGVVDQDMELAETPQRYRDNLLPGALVGDVLAQKQDLAALAGETLGQALASSGVDVGQDHRGFFL